ncbi:mechanosensitive ion channel family protein [Clostridium sp. YIM B02505]|uniref:Mechanosensitive ion channel family protein n=1 Tax=Clostridium yunnanense TaxID=2800325 RepID=A0ABS1EUV2_9CLOT|nr:mechanosensitive ion channel family protein [Clostridium yunnanense]MBK1813137.1 mechanosensitive ion channel family protein [Clostridium yunnanense]
MSENIKKEKKKKTKVEIISMIINILLYMSIAAFILIGVFAEKLFGPDNIFTQNIGSIFDIKGNLMDNLPNILKCMTYIILVYFLSKLARYVLNKLLNVFKKGKTAINLLDSFIKYGCGIAIIFLFLGAVGVDTTTLLASAGILGLAVGLGAQSIIEDVIAGLFLVFEKTFVVGDVVIANGFRGTIKEVGIRTTKIVDIGGDTKVINNSKITDVINMTNHLSLAVCDVEIEYGESLERVEAILAERLEEIGSRITGIVEGPFYKGVGALNTNGVSLKIIANCHEKDKFQIRRELNREIKLLFDECNIDMPYPHIVVNDSTEFSKPTKEDINKAREFMLRHKELSKHIENDIH